MDTAVIQRQYDDLIAPHYDLDPQNLMAMSLDRALDNLRDTELLNFTPGSAPLRTLDLGMGTGTFLHELSQQSIRDVEPCGIDLSANMIRVAENKLPGLEAYVDDAARFDRHFPDAKFDLISTHFMTGFVPVETLAPMIYEHLAPGGYWSFVGSSSLAYPRLREIAESRLIRLIFKGRSLPFDNMIVPQNEETLHDAFRDSGFEPVTSSAFEPELHFPDMQSFMSFAYNGGWLTPFIEALGLQHAGRTTRALLNRCVFPVHDHHHILLALVRRPPE